MRNELWMCALAALTMAACDGDPATDAGPIGDAGPSGDAEPIADGGGTDAGPADAGPTGPCLACGTEEICVRGVCLDACGATGEALEAALGAGLTPVTNYCRPATARAFHDGQVWDVTTEVAGTVTTFTLSRWTPGDDVTGLTVVGTSTYDTGDAEAMTFAGSYLAISDDGANAAFGYTDSTFGGEVVVDRMGGTALTLDAGGNFDATFLGDDTLVVNGLALGATDGGQGLYAVDVTGSAPTPAQVLTNLGMFSGSVAATADYVVAGGFEEAGFVYVVPRADLEGALSTAALDAVTEGAEVLDPDGEPFASGFALVAGRLVAQPFGGPMTSYAASWDGTDLTTSDATVLGTDGTFTDVVEGPSDRLLLVHGGGLLLVE